MVKKRVNSATKLTQGTDNNFSAVATTKIRLEMHLLLLSKQTEANQLFPPLFLPQSDAARREIRIKSKDKRLHQPPNSRIQADSWPSNNKKDFEKRVNRD
jgi:hypothetical protein